MAFGVTTVLTCGEWIVGALVFTEMLLAYLQRNLKVQLRIEQERRKVARLHYNERSLEAQRFYAEHYSGPSKPLVVPEDPEA